MYARVTTFRGQPNKFQEGLRKFEEQIPELRKNPGFQDIYCMTDRHSGNCVIVALWESEQTLQNASGAVKPLRDEVVRAFGATDMPKVDVYEVSYWPGKAMRKAA